ncbi:MAG: PIN domain-containing protein, partial [Pseudomonadota bacterium]
MLMATGASLVFLDTNIFVYAFMANEPRKRERAVQLIESCLGSGRGCVSYQVIQEFAKVARKKFAARMDAAACKACVDAAMQPMNHVAGSTALVFT